MKKGLFFFYAFFITSIFALSSTVSAETILQLRPTKRVYSSRESVVSVSAALIKSDKFRRIYFSTYRVKNPLEFLRTQSSDLDSPKIQQNDSFEPYPASFEKVSLLPDEQIVASTTAAEHNWDSTATQFDLPLLNAQKGVYLIEAYLPAKTDETSCGEQPCAGVLDKHVKKGEGEYRYTTVLISDVALDSRVASDKVLIWGINRLQQGSASGVAVSLVSTKTGEVLNSKVTDENGFAEFNTPQLSDDDRMLVFGKTNQDVSFINLSYLPSSSEGQYRVYTYTDRPLYRPKDVVQFKAIVRKNSNGGYSHLAKKTLTVVLYDTHGEELSRSSLKTNEFGTVDGTFRLENVKPGNLRYTIEIPSNVEGERAQSFTNSVQVQAYEKASFEVSAKTSSESGTYLPGQNLSFTVSAQNYSGSLVREATVSYNVERRVYDILPAGSREEEGAPVFGARGRAGSWMNARDFIFEEDRTVSLTNGQAQINVKQPALAEEEKGKYTDYVLVFRVTDTNDETVAGSASAYVVPAEFQISAEVENSFYTEGETAEVKIETKDYTGKNASRSVKLVVTSQSGNKNIYHLTTSAEKDSLGTLSLPLSLSEVGLTTVQLSAQDASGNQTKASLDFHVVPVDEQIGMTYKKTNEWDPAVTVISEKRAARYSAGERARFLILSTVKTSAALLTLDAESVLEKRIISLASGWSVVEVELERKHAPNFNVSVTVPGVDSPENASRHVKVEDDSMKALVSLQTSSKNGKNNEDGVLVVPPGDTVEYSVSARDRNVSLERDEYEVSLAVVQEAIFALNPGYVQDIHDFFYGGRYVNVQRHVSYGYEEWLTEHGDRSLMAGRKSVAEAAGAPDGGSVDIRSDFRDTALWVGSVQTQGGRARLSQKLPDDLTTWRASAIAVSKNTSVGGAQTSFMSWKPLEVKLSIPKSLTEGDELTVTAVVQNNTKENKTTAIRLESQGVEILDEASQSVEIPAEGSTTLSFRVRVGNAREASLTLAADAGSMTDGVKLSRPVLPLALQRAVVKSGWFSSENGSLSVELPEKVVGDSVKAELLLTPSWAGAALAGISELVLDEYHGNAMQVATSLRQAVAVNQAYTTDLNIGSDELSEKVLNSIQKGVRKLKSLQKKDGSWTAGRNTVASETLTTSTAVLALSEVERSGLVQINRELSAEDEIKAAQKFLLKTLELAAGPNVDAQLSQGDAALVHVALTSSGSVEAVDRLRNLIVNAQISKQDDATLALLALAVQNLQKLSSFDATGAGAWLPEQEGSLLSKLEKSAVKGESSLPLHWTTALDGSVGVEEATALVITAFLGSSANGTVRVSLADAIVWLSLQRQTQKWSGIRGEENLVSAFTLSLAGEPKNATSTVEVASDSSRLGNASWEGDYRVRSFETRGDKSTFQLSGGKGYVSAVLRVSYLERSDTLNEESRGLSVKREYFRVKNRGGQLTARPIRDNEVSQGDKVMVRLTVTSAHDYANVGLTDYFPAGARVVEDEPMFAQTRGARGVALDWGTYFVGTQHTTWDERVTFDLARVKKGETVLSYTLEIAKEADRSQALPAVVELKAYPALRGNTSMQQLTILSEDF